MEVTSHHLGQLDEPDAFAFDVGLVGGRAASKAIKKVLIDELELEHHVEAANSIKVSAESRFSPLAACHKSDFVLYKDGQGDLKAGKVQLHCEVLGLPISLVSAFEACKNFNPVILDKTNRIKNEMVWRKPTRQIRQAH